MRKEFLEPENQRNKKGRQFFLMRNVNQDDNKRL